MDKIFKGLFDTDLTPVIAVEDFLICVGVALVLGVLIALVHSFKSRYSKSFVMTVAVLPAVVCVVIMMVNGNIGAGVAVAGAFSLVRFRSAPGSAREIATIFLSMGSGLVCGMGYIGYAVLFTVIIGGFMMLISAVGFGDRKKASREKTLKITIPEDLEFSGLFDDVFEEYTKSHVQTSVKTAAMGSLYKIKYDIVLKDISKEKEFIDELRCRNGNLEVSLYDKENDVL